MVDHGVEGWNVPQNILVMAVSHCAFMKTHSFLQPKD